MAGQEEIYLICSGIIIIIIIIGGTELCVCAPEWKK